MKRCKDCDCVITISDPPLPNRTGYYCQGCGEDKQIYQTYESEEKLYTVDLVNRLKADIERLEKGQFKEAMTFNSNTIRSATNEALREFAERVKEKIYVARFNKATKKEFSVATINPDDIDNLLKEMVGEG